MLIWRILSSFYANDKRGRYSLPLQWGMFNGRLLLQQDQFGNVQISLTE